MEEECRTERVLNGGNRASIARMWNCPNRRDSTNVRGSYQAWSTCFGTMTKCFRDTVDILSEINVSTCAFQNGRENSKRTYTAVNKRIPIV